MAKQHRHVCDSDAEGEEMRKWEVEKRSRRLETAVNVVVDFSCIW